MQAHISLRLHCSVAALLSQLNIFAHTLCIH
ncbi:hypothetical protein GLYMA_06G111166v4 [Glycine max]|nr:hypothetical protein GLYMA_06G111166v4 [Glycine max]KAH1125322.1 hypothetical protein GYH30_014752 [Glycine max]